MEKMRELPHLSVTRRFTHQLRSQNCRLFSHSLGTVHFLRGRGGWWDLGGVTKKKALKGGPTKKNKRKFSYLGGGGGHATF